MRGIESPAGLGSAEPNLHAGAHGLYLSWLAPAGDRKALQYAVLKNGSWSEVRTIVEAADLLANWADFPSIVELADGSLAAHWLRARPEGGEAYDALVARSSDGVHWSTGMTPYSDTTATQHGFVHLVPGAGGALTAVWLDGRDYAGKEEGAPGAQMRLMVADLAPIGRGPTSFGPERLLDPRVCDCCQTAAVPTGRGMLVAYRDRSPDEIRDMSLVRLEGSRWSKPYPLSRDGWRIPGCPVNGPALAADGDRVAAVWFTIKEGQAMVHAAMSRHRGVRFSKPERIDAGNPLGHVDVALLPSGDAVVVWLENAADGQSILCARRVGKDGKKDASLLVGGEDAPRAGGVPRIARLGGTMYLAWTDPGEPSQVRLAQLEPPPAAP